MVTAEEWLRQLFRPETGIVSDTPPELNWYDKPLDMRGRATILPFKESNPELSGSVMNQKEWAVPGLLAEAYNTIIAPGRAAKGLLNPEEAANFALNTMGGGLLSSGAMRNPTGAGGVDIAANAWHGSPYLMKEFDISKIGTGEGGQAFGAGAGYVAQARPVAEKYASDVAQKRLAETIGDPTSPKAIAADLYYYSQNNLKQSIDDAKYYNNSAAIIKELRNLDKNPPTGYLYKGDVPDEIIPTFLDWDRQITDQPEIVQNFVRSLKVPDEIKGNKSAAMIRAWQEGRDVGELPKGRDIYGLLERMTGSKLDASKMLENAGSLGIRYFDEGSRGVGKGTSNFVVFRPQDYKIQEINDIPIKEWMRKGLLK